MNPGVTYTEPILAIWFLLAVLGWVRLRRRGRYGALVAAFFLLFLASLARGRLAFFCGARSALSHSASCLRTGGGHSCALGERGAGA